MLELLLPALLGVSLLSTVFMHDGADSSDADQSDGDSEADDVLLPSVDTGSGGLLDDDNVTSEDDTGFTSGDDGSDESGTTDIAYDAHARGSLLGTDGDDHITVNVETSDDFSDLWWNEYVEPQAEVHGGDGNDTIELSGSGYAVSGGEGSDLIEINDASRVAVYAGDGDTVVGGTGGYNFIELGEGASFEGGDGVEYVISRSSSEINLGSGNDSYLGVGDRAQHVSGGEGNDFMAGSVWSLASLDEVHAGDAIFVSSDHDTLDGGDGNDTIVGSFGDVLIGGEGDDRFTLVLDCSVDLGVAVIEDFLPGNDTLFIHYSAGVEGTSLSYDQFTQSVNSNGETEIQDSTTGQVLVRLGGVTDVAIGVLNWVPGEGYVTTDLNGSHIDQSLCDVILRSRILEYGL